MTLDIKVCCVCLCVTKEMIWHKMIWHKMND